MYLPISFKVASLALGQWESAKLAGPQATTDVKLEGPVKNMGGSIKVIFVIMFEILKSCH